MVQSHPMIEWSRDGSGPFGRHFVQAPNQHQNTSEHQKSPEKNQSPQKDQNFINIKSYSAKRRYQNTVRRMLYFWITTAVHRARHESGSPGSRFGSKPKGRMRRKNHFSSESSLDKMAGPPGSPGNGGSSSSSGSSSSGTMSPSKASSPSPLVAATAAVISYSRSSSGGSTTLPEKPMCSKRKTSTTSLTLWIHSTTWRKQKTLQTFIVEQCVVTIQS